jgi:multiple sugar transport system permease protein
MDKAKDYLKLKKWFYVTEHKIKNILLAIVRMIVLVGIAYIIIGPFLQIISKSFMSIEDAYSPLVYLIPRRLDFENIGIALSTIDYLPTLSESILYALSIMIIQVIVSAIVGYGFARFDFPLKNLLFAGVILTIVVPVHTIMVPLYTEFRYFDFFGLMGTLGDGNGISLIGSKTPMVMMTALGNGLRTGLYIYIFRQFFRGLPKAIEEAALIDGAGVYRTFATIMLPNAKPAIITVLLFSFVWQYNDIFYATLFIPNSNLMAVKLTTLAGYVGSVLRINDYTHMDLIVSGAVLMAILPMIIVYLFFQRHFVEGVERSGIVG